MKIRTNRLLGLVLLSVIGLASVAQARSLLLMGVGGPGAASGPVFTFRGTDSTNSATSVFTSTTIDIGSARSDRLVIVATSDQSANAISSVSVNGSPPLNLDVTAGGGPGLQIWSGLISSGSGVATIVVNYASGASFTGRVLDVWTATGLASNVVKHTATFAGTSSATISVGAGDFLVAAEPFGGVTFTGSAPDTTPVMRSNPSVTPPTLVSAEWITITTNNASFSVTASASLGTGCVASYR
jgi:hypothetical protein